MGVRVSCLTLQWVQPEGRSSVRQTMRLSLTAQLTVFANLFGLSVIVLLSSIGCSVYVSMREVARPLRWDLITQKMEKGSYTPHVVNAERVNGNAFMCLMCPQVSWTSHRYPKINSREWNVRIVFLYSTDIIFLLLSGVMTQSYNGRMPIVWQLWFSHKCAAIRWHGGSVGCLTAGRSRFESWLS